MNESAFDEAYEKYGKMLYRIAFLYLGNAEDAEDALQEVFIKYLYNSKPFKDEGNEKAWLIKVTQNKCKDILKSGARNNLSLDSLDLAEEQSNNDLKLDIAARVAALPLKYKEAVILYYYNGYSVSVIAHILKTGKSAVKMRLSRGRELLKLDLEEYES